MALGSSWGTREEMLHPRDRRGRFRKKWKMPDGVINKLQAFLERFNPRTFQSDQQAAQFVFNKAKPGRFPGDDQKRLHMDWDEANDHIRAGDIDPSTQRFIQMMDGAQVQMPEQMILHRTVGPEAFGLTPDQLGLEDGGLEDFTGRLIADRAYGATNIGSPMGTGPGRIHMTIATPHGQPAIIPASTPNDRRVFLPRDQGLRITRVKPDGTGGWHVMAIAEPPGVARKTPEPVMPGRRGAGLSEAQREARITPSMTPQQRLDAAGNPPTAQRAAEQRGDVPAPAPAPTAAPAPAPSPVQGPTSPATGVPERQEPVLRDAVGPTAPSGTSPAEVAQAGEAAAKQAAEAQAAPAPATPESFRQAFKDANPPAPSRGKRQKEYNDALGGIASGKSSPEEALRQLDTDIEVNKRQLERQKAGTEKPDPELERDIQAQEALADLISSHNGVPRRGQGQAAEAPTPAPTAKGRSRSSGRTGDGTSPTPTPAKKQGPTPTPGAPSTKREATPKAPAPKKAAKRAPSEVADALKSAGTREEADGHLEGLTTAELRQVATETGTVGIGARSTKAQLRQAIVQKTTGRRLDSDAISGNGRRMRGDDTTDTERRLIEAAKKYRGKERNSEEKRIVDEADKILARQGAKAAPEAPAPTKAVPKKAAPAKAAPSPVDAEEEAFKARVTEAGLPDRVTALRDMAREKKIRGFSTMNKKQLQSALLGDEVPKAGKIAPVTPQKLVPHIQAAKSDQEARGLLKDHTLVDLKALAKSRELTIPKKGATKDKLKDMILADVRGQEEGVGGRMPEQSLMQELESQGWVKPEFRDIRDRVEAEIRGTDQTDPDSLREHRDNLEAYSKEIRAQGNRNDANLIQTVADTMGMRAQVISGVEEPPVRAPAAKRVAKAAVPEVPEGEVPERPIEKMLKPELLALATKEGASVRPSWTKARILDEIKKNRRMDSSRGPETADERMRRELGAVPGGPERQLGPDQGPIQLPNRAPTMEEIARDSGIPGDAGGIVTQADAVLKNEGPTAAAKYLRTEADRVEERVPGRRERTKTRSMPIPGEADKVEAEDRASAQKLRDMADKVEAPKAQKRVPKGSVEGPKADVPIETPDRRDAFTEAFDAQGFNAPGTAGKALGEVRDRVASGEWSPEEGVRRLEGEIAFQKDDLIDLDAELRGLPAGSEGRDRRTQLQQQRRQLEANIKIHEKASRFIRDHFKKEAPVTRRELEVKLDGPELAALQRADVEDLKRAARDEGLGDIQGDDKDTVVQNIGRAIAAREMANREKAAAPSAPEAPAAPAKAAGLLEPRPKAPKATKKAAQAAPAGPIDIPSLLERLNNNDNPMSREDAGALVADLNRAQLQEMAKSLSIPAGSRRTMPDTRRAIVDATVGRRLDSIAIRGFRGDRPGGPEPDLPEDAPARQLAESHRVTSAPLRLPPKAVDLDNPTRHNAELIGTGLDLDPDGQDKQWLKIVQEDLDKGTDGRQIADGLRREADAQRTIHNIQEASGGTAGASPEARINRMELMADRLEGVRPLKKEAPAKAVPETAAGPGKREMDTMQAASAQSDALRDLRNGKSHAEVATALRARATSVGSKDHDVQTVRPLEFTPSERSAMKRNDAKKLRELAAEIQAQGVAQRAAAKAAKKAAPAKKAKVNPNLSSLSDDELRKIIASDQFPQSQKDKVQGELDARARRDLTGPLGEVIANQLNDTIQRVTEAKSDQEASGALSGLLLPELKQLAQRVGVPTSGSKETIRQRIRDRLRGAEAPTTSATRSLPDGPPIRRHSPGITDGQGRIVKRQRVKEDVPIRLPNGGEDQGLVHIDSSLGGLWADLYQDDREPNSFINEIGEIGDKLGMVRDPFGIDEDVIPRLKDLKARASDKQVADRIQETIDDISAPEVPMPDLPEGTPAAVRRYLEELRKIPTARKTGRIGANVLDTSVFDQQVQLIRDIAAGKVDPRIGFKRLKTRHIHESGDGAVRMWDLAETIFRETSPKFDEAGNLTSGNPDFPAVFKWLRAFRDRQQ